MTDGGSATGGGGSGFGAASAASATRRSAVARIGASRPGVAAGVAAVGSRAGAQPCLALVWGRFARPRSRTPRAAASPLPVSAACSAVRRPLTSQRCRSARRVRALRAASKPSATTHTVFTEAKQAPFCR